MIEESLNTYRQERRSFILGLKHYYGIDFYHIEVKERKEWLRSYIENKRIFFESMMEYWRDNPPDPRSLPRGYTVPVLHTKDLVAKEQKSFSPGFI